MKDLNRSIRPAAFRTATLLHEQKERDTRREAPGIESSLARVRRAARLVPLAEDS